MHALVFSTKITRLHTFLISVVTCSRCGHPVLARFFDGPDVTMTGYVARRTGKSYVQPFPISLTHPQDAHHARPGMSTSRRTDRRVCGAAR